MAKRGLVDARASEGVRTRFETALAKFLDRARMDPYVLAVIVAGSMSHDKVWEKSDLDLIVITEERGGPKSRKDQTGFTLVEEEVPIHAMVTSRGAFRKIVESSLQSSFMHSLIAKSYLAFTRDQTLAELYEGIGKLGARDRQVQLLDVAAGAVACLYKAQKWYQVKGDCEYAAVWILMCVQQLAKLEVFMDGQIAGREVLQQAMAVNPGLFKRVYVDFVNATKTPKVVAGALAEIEGYLKRKSRMLFGPILEYLDEAGAPRSATEITTYFQQHFSTEMAVSACEWLADTGMITHMSLPVRLTEKSKVEFDEMAFFFEAEMAGEK